MRPAAQPPEVLRVALVAGTLGKGGAEKQLVYMARALRDAGVQVRVFCLTRGEYYEQALASSGLAPTWTGRWGSPPLRVLALWRAMSSFKPHVVQSAHFYTNLYAAAAARLLGAISIGAIRNNANFELRANGGWARWLMQSPDALLANSRMAQENAVHLGVSPRRLAVLTNVIDLVEFDRLARPAAGFPETPARVRVALVARQVGFKRIDRFLRVLALARRQEPGIQGVLAGDGPERPALEAQAAALGLLAPDGGVPGVVFLGERHDIPELLSACDLFLLTSDDEGFPNVILEAMAACLPVITTGAGEAAVVVEEGRTGYVVPLGSEEDQVVESLAGRLLLLARQPALRTQLGQAGRQRVEQLYGLDGLAGRLLDIYRQFAGLRSDRRLARLLEAWSA